VGAAPEVLLIEGLSEHFQGALHYPILEGGHPQRSEFSARLRDIHPTDWGWLVLLLPELFREPLNPGFVHVVFGLPIDSRSLTSLVVAESFPGFGEPSFFTENPLESLEAGTWVLLRQCSSLLWFPLDVSHRVSSVLGVPLALGASTCVHSKASEPAALRPVHGSPVLRLLRRLCPHRERSCPLRTSLAAARWRFHGSPMTLSPTAVGPCPQLGGGRVPVLVTLTPSV